MLLLTVIYIAFIGLGLPDSMFGTAWPAIYQEWGLPFSFGSFIVSIIYCGTMFSSLLSAKVINHFGTNILLLAAAGFFLIGFGNGPLFPNFNYLTPIIFGEEASPSIMGVQMAVSSLSSMTTPILCGFLGQQIGMWIFPLYLLVFFIGMTATGLRVNKMFWSMK